MFRTFIDLHSLPSEWRHSNITPKFKKGLHSDPANYKPIALTCCCCKILESIIASTLINYLQEHNLINNQQHGFLKDHSTCTNLLESLNDWTLSISNHESVVVGYIDFARAFDFISHPKLFIKLQGYGIKCNLLFWIQAFLTDRTQSVQIGSSLSLNLVLWSAVSHREVSWAQSISTFSLTTSLTIFRTSLLNSLLMTSNYTPTFLPPMQSPTFSITFT